MIRISILVVACLFALLQQQGVESLLTPSTQDQPKSSPVAPNGSEAPQGQKTVQKIRLSPEEVADIVSIRQQLGETGVSGVLGDLSLEMPGQRKDQTDGKPALSLEQEFQKQLAAQVSTRKPADDKKSPPLGNFDHQPSTKRQDAIRKSARKLEEAAAILEEVHSYDHADDVRRAASELWKSARQR